MTKPIAGRSNRLLHLCPIALACILLATATGCTSPLRPGQELQTGGRTALSQWEVYDALTQMYQAQVLLNLVRLCEYGEAPVHFEFTDILAIIDDKATVAMGLEFFDSPVGGTIVNGVRVPNTDTNVRFTPNLSASRDVQIQAKANPLIRQSWIYEWYYRMADQYTAHDNLRLYERLDGTKAFSTAAARTRFGLWYKGHYFVLKECFSGLSEEEKKAVGVRLENQDKVADDVKIPTPAEELGALTAILSFLQSSSPSDLTAWAVIEADDADFRPMVITARPTASSQATASSQPSRDEAEDVLALHITSESRDRYSWLSGLGQKLAKEGPYQLTIQIPTAPGQPYFVREYKLVFARPGDWLFDAHPIDSKLKTALEEWRKLPPKDRRIFIVLPFDRALEQNVIISPFKAVRAVATHKTLPPERKDKDVLEDILSTLQRIQAQKPTG